MFPEMVTPLASCLSKARAKSVPLLIKPVCTLKCLVADFALCLGHEGAGSEGQAVFHIEEEAANCPYGCRPVNHLVRGLLAFSRLKYLMSEAATSPYTYVRDLLVNSQ
jgi:hypothetical protein